MPKHQVTTWFHQTNNRVQIEEQELASFNITVGSAGSGGAGGGGGTSKVFNVRETRGMSLGELAQLGELIGEVLATSGVIQAPQPAMTWPQPPAPGQPVNDGYVPQRPVSPHAMIMEE